MTLSKSWKARNGALRDKGKGTPFFIVFTDLDGTLLDHETYSWEPARPALERCRQLQVPVILVSSKTRAEMEPLRTVMGLTAPFIVENGGAVCFPAGPDQPAGEADESGMVVWHLGLPYGRLVAALEDIRAETGWPIRGFAEMDLQEIARLTGLSLDEARLATRREYDEPFVIGFDTSIDPAVLENAARKRGLQVVAGGRFFHLQGRNDKGRAVRMVTDRFKQTHANVFSVALGDSPNDFSMLEQVDYPVLVRSKHDYSHLRLRIPNLRVTGLRGPHGWNEAVAGILTDLS